MNDDVDARFIAVDPHARMVRSVGVGVEKDGAGVNCEAELTKN
jgi:hypothetical protein